MQLPLFKSDKKHEKPGFSGTKKNILNDILKTDLNFTVYNEVNRRHYWHAFPAKFPPQLPALFIEYLTDPDEIVLDPMMGSATTLIEANRLGRRSYGLDIDPLAIINTNAKLKCIDRRRIENHLNSIVYNAENKYKSNKKFLAEKIDKRFDEATMDFLNYWFQKSTQLELMALLTEIEKIEDDDIISILYSVFSSTIITKSGGVSMARDLAHTRPHRVQGKKVKSAIQEFAIKVRKILNENVNGVYSNQAAVIKGNARNIPLRDETVNLIVTSPPYANNAIDYMRAHKFSLVWLGYSINELKELRKQYIGAESKININEEPFSKRILKKIESIAEIKSSKSQAFRRYCYEMLKSINEMYRVLEKESPCIIVVASSKICGIDVETHKCLADLGREVGFEVIGIGKRLIDRNRRMMPFSAVKGNSKIEERMHQEYVIGFWKN